MILELILSSILIMVMITVVAVSVSKMRDEQHKRHVNWMKEQLGDNNES